MGELPALEVMPKCGWVVRPTRRLGRVATRCLFIDVSSQAIRKPMKSLLVPPAPGQTGRATRTGHLSNRLPSVLRLPSPPGRGAGGEGTCHADELPPSALPLHSPRRPNSFLFAIRWKIAQPLSVCIYHISYPTISVSWHEISFEDRSATNEGQFKLVG